MSKVFTTSSLTQVLLDYNIILCVLLLILLILYNTILAEKTTRANIGIVLSISKKLRGIGRPEAANLLIGKIINSLPESYARFRSVWEATPVAERTMEILQ